VWFVCVVFVGVCGVGWRLVLRVLGYSVSHMLSHLGQTRASDTHTHTHTHTHTLTHTHTHTHTLPCTRADTHTLTHHTHTHTPTCGLLLERSYKTPRRPPTPHALMPHTLTAIT